MIVLVRATRPGFHGHRRKPGEPPFEVEEQHFSAKWMEKVEPEPAPAPAPKPQAKAKAKAKAKAAP